MSAFHTPSISPSASGRNTPLGHFRDLVSALRKNTVLECGHLFDLACKTFQSIANNMLASNPLTHHILVNSMLETSMLEHKMLENNALENSMLTGTSTQVHDAMRSYKTEDDSEAHQVRLYAASATHILTLWPIRSSVSQLAIKPKAILPRR
jgi:hypothetical protein